MSHRLFFTYNRPESVENHYVVGSGVGSKSRFVRSALRRRSSNNAQGKPCCIIMSNSYVIQSPIKNKIKYILNNTSGSGYCDLSFTPYTINDTSMCCWSDDYNKSPIGCKDINSVCYVGQNKGLHDECPNNNIMECNNVTWSCDTTKGLCAPSQSGKYKTISDCSKECTSQPPSGLPEIKKVLYLSKATITNYTGWELVTTAITESIAAGFNILILSFITTGRGDFSITDTLLYTTGNLISGWWWKWMKTPIGPLEHTKQEDFITNSVHNNNAKLFVSAGGATDKPWVYYPGDKATQYGKDIAKWVVDNHLDGIDFDLENIGRGFLTSSLTTEALIKWITDATTGAYDYFNNANTKQYFISHAPQAPYFGPLDLDLTCSTTKPCWADNIVCPNTHVCNAPFVGSGPDGGGYTKIFMDCSNMIDFFNVQFYNQSATAYDTYDSLIKTSTPWQYGTSYTQIHSYGIPYDKLIVGKPMFQDDVDNTGYITDVALNTIYKQIKKELSITNIHTMVWQYHSQKDMTSKQKTQYENWIKNVYSDM